MKLGDGSLVEMNERSELSVARGGAGATIRLNRGDIIVQAARQRSGSLNVLTPDFLISVKGTVFSVSRGTKGSRVSVIEGAVNVERGSQGQMLKPGDQVVTDPSLEKIPIADTVAWSPDAAKYVALLGELASILQKKLEAALPAGLRYQSKLLGDVTPSTVIFAAVPNLGSAIGEAQKVLQERLQQSPVLREWWNEHNGRGKLEEMIEKVRASSEFLGEEIVLAVDGDWEGHFSPPLVLAELKRPGVCEFLEAEIRQMQIRGEKPLPEIVELKTAAEQSKSFYLRDRGANQAANEHMLIGIKDHLVAVAWNQQQLDRLAARLRHGPHPGGQRWTLQQHSPRLREGSGMDTGIRYGTYRARFRRYPEEAGEPKLSATGLGSHALSDRREKGDRGQDGERGDAFVRRPARRHGRMAGGARGHGHARFRLASRHHGGLDGAAPA